jgi:hypothetical protein
VASIHWKNNLWAGETFMFFLRRAFMWKSTFSRTLSWSSGTCGVPSSWAPATTWRSTAGPQTWSPPSPPTRYSPARSTPRRTPTAASSTSRYRMHCKEDSNYVFPEIKQRGLVLNCHIHISVSDLYIPRIGPPILLQPNKQTDRGNI